MRTIVIVLVALWYIAAPGAAPAAEPPTVEPNDGDETQRLLSEHEKARGPTFPGNDPAFLVLPRPAERSRMARELLTPQVRQMTEQSLAYLIQTQDSDGGWSDNQFPSNTGVTALCCLAFMAEGSRPRIGKYGKQIDRGIEFIRENAPER